MTSRDKKKEETQPGLAAPAAKYRGDVNEARKSGSNQRKEKK